MLLLAEKSNALAAQPTAAAQVSNVADRRSRSAKPKSASITVVAGQVPRLRRAKRGLLLCTECMVKKPRQREQSVR